MGQLNINVTPEFEQALRRLMKARGFRSKADAIRVAVSEAAERGRAAHGIDFAKWIGIGRGAPENPAPRFPSDDALWAKG